ncbi:MAG: bifunctional nuclease family protein [Proteobacteria bacterium]|nr:bifunctional nuclease family protein [Pseudomonadota bacterium]
MLIEMKVHSVEIDPFSRVPIIMLKDLDKERTLPVWIGAQEASSINAHLESKSSSRPMTHDIIKVMLEKLKAEVLRVELTDLKNNIYYASIHLSCGGETFKIDSRPSDAIAVALRADAKIMVEEKVIEKSMDIKVESFDESDLDSDELLEMLDELNVEDLGKYKM